MKNVVSNRVFNHIISGKILGAPFVCIDRLKKCINLDARKELVHFFGYLECYDLIATHLYDTQKMGILDDVCIKLYICSTSTNDYFNQGVVYDYVVDWYYKKINNAIQNI